MAPGVDSTEVTSSSASSAARSDSPVQPGRVGVSVHITERDREAAPARSGDMRRIRG